MVLLDVQVETLVLNEQRLRGELLFILLAATLLVSAG